MPSIADRSSAPPARAEPDEWPPVPMMLAAGTSLAGLVPALLAAVVGLPWLLIFLAGAFLLPFSEGADPDEVLLLTLQVQGGLLVVGLPVAMLLGGIRLLKRRDRKLLVVAYLPATAIAAGWLFHGASTGSAGPWWAALLLLGPALAPAFALAPSVGRWLSTRPPARAGSSPVRRTASTSEAL